MSAELLYTSAPQGLKQGSRGFCTVLCTAGMPINLAQKLESLSGYRHVYPPKDPNAHRNPVAYSHLRFSLGGRTTSVLSRVADYGLDYSQRTNKIAHHVALHSPLPACGPAALLVHPGWMRDAWDGVCATLPEGPSIPGLVSEPHICSTWQAIAGDAGWGGVVAQAWLEATNKPTFMIFSEDQADRLLSLIDESIALLPVQKRWNATFSTYVTTLPPDVECRVRCVLAGTEEARMAAARGSVLDLTRPMGSAPETQAAIAARTGTVIGGAKGTADAAVLPPVNSEDNHAMDGDPWEAESQNPASSSSKEVEDFEFELQPNAPSFGPGVASPPKMRKAKQGVSKKQRIGEQRDGRARPKIGVRKIAIGLSCLVLLMTTIAGGTWAYRISKEFASVSHSLPKLDKSPRDEKTIEPIGGEMKIDVDESHASESQAGKQETQLTEENRGQMRAEKDAPSDPAVTVNVPQLGPEVSGPQEIPTLVMVERSLPIFITHGPVSLSYPVLGSTVAVEVDPAFSKLRWQKRENQKWIDINDGDAGELEITEQLLGATIRCMAQRNEQVEIASNGYPECVVVVPRAFDVVLDLSDAITQDSLKNIRGFVRNIDVDIKIPFPTEVACNYYYYNSELYTKDDDPTMLRFKVALRELLSDKSIGDLCELISRWNEARVSLGKSIQELRFEVFRHLEQGVVESAFGAVFDQTRVDDLAFGEKIQLWQEFCDAADRFSKKLQDIQENGRQEDVGTQRDHAIAELRKACMRVNFHPNVPILNDELTRLAECWAKKKVQNLLKRVSEDFRRHEISLGKIQAFSMVERSEGTLCIFKVDGKTKRVSVAESEPLESGVKAEDSDSRFGFFVQVSVKVPVIPSSVASASPGQSIGGMGSAVKPSAKSKEDPK